jgi:hypothetical protein
MPHLKHVLCMLCMLCLLASLFMIDPVFEMGHTAYCF